MLLHRDPLPVFPSGRHAHCSVSSAIFARDDGPAAVVLRVVHLTEVGEPAGDDPGEDGDDGFVITLADIRGDGFLRTAPLSDRALYETARAALKSGRYLIAEGTIAPLPQDPGGKRRRKTDRGLRLHLRALYTHFRPSALLGATQDELAAADALIERQSKTPGALQRHILDEAHAILNVLTGPLSPRFRQAELLVLLQALSAGQVDDGCNPRLSTYIVSQPSQGKKILSRLATLLAPTSALLQPHNASLAGITARVEPRRGGGFAAHPGEVPRSHLGVCVLEDFHQAEGSLRRALRGILLSVTEDGMLALRKAGSATYQTQAAMHINGNRAPDVLNRPRGQTAKARLEDLGLGFDLFSRLDIVMELDCDTDPAQVAIELSKRAARPRTPCARPGATGAAATCRC